ncbi:hypothetical protein [Halobaculum sp. EA56]|uniref:hypothetical protein n=1 Tax=Halobaculum sp. EA56 TaxID=3421648 RepID=UPI003EB73E29
MNELIAAALAVAALASPLALDRFPSPIARPLAATAGTLAVAYGGREVLRALGGGYYCCSHAYYALAGAVLVFLGWVALVPALGAGPGLAPRGDDTKRSP